MENLTSKIFSKFSLGSKATQSDSKVVKGTPDVIAQYVYQDILFLKNEIKKYNELTGIFTTNTFYYKVFKILEAEHVQELHKLKQKFEYESKNPSFQRQLLEMYKRNLQDYSNLMEIMKNNYNHGIYESNIVNYRLGSLLSDVSSTNDISSNRNSVFSSNVDRTYHDDLVETTLSNKEIADQITTDAPDTLLDPISFNLFSDPVITPSGITYEKLHLVEHLQKKGKFDPLTRAPLTESQLYPNLLVKDAVEDYISSKQVSFGSQRL
ncbi:U-box-domain-containing protein [Suhomyces tanzawaensis NRRL Y-17324]|uniref:RING-type E3 ubiquitin transferase n=1 Tax=Suhomyces tanzawaensis NRRL Y-17324 TaxID=984487 RepID=A0A1E4SHP9_9ASCO|nr:U-box-domain-containing protein [Suhomyces tanzawaensis NRRL Y-17324]ODV79038.1 U-box-domain-containing protein [Suhomyces tanzawaensis NRRL Y-17324]